MLQGAALPTAWREKAFFARRSARRAPNLRGTRSRKSAEAPSSPHRPPQYTRFRAEVEKCWARELLERASAPWRLHPRYLSQQVSHASASMFLLPFFRRRGRVKLDYGIGLLVGQPQDQVIQVGTTG
jgi:hypothetical protein